MLLVFEFFKVKIKNALDSHMGFVVGLYSQRQFNLMDFPFDPWMGGAEFHRNVIKSWV